MNLFIIRCIIVGVYFLKFLLLKKVSEWLEVSCVFSSLEVNIVIYENLRLDGFFLGD